MTITEHERICQAYLEMAKRAQYRPESSSDAAREDSSATRLSSEASAYADRFIASEENGAFHVGVSDHQTNRALVYTIEAARQLCEGRCGDETALKLLEMAIKEVKESQRSEQ